MNWRHPFKIQILGQSVIGFTCRRLWKGRCFLPNNDKTIRYTQYHGITHSVIVICLAFTYFRYTTYSSVFITRTCLVSTRLTYRKALKQNNIFAKTVYLPGGFLVFKIPFPFASILSIFSIISSRNKSSLTSHSFDIDPSVEE